MPQDLTELSTDAFVRASFDDANNRERQREIQAERYRRAPNGDTSALKRRLKFGMGILDKDDIGPRG